jgi:hypothetical protein
MRSVHNSRLDIGAKMMQSLADTVGTLRTGYPRVQASSQDNGSRLPAEGSSEAATCLHGSGSRSQLEAALGPPCVPSARAPPPGSGQLRGPPRVPTARAPAPSSEQLRRRHVSPQLELPLRARGSSGAVTCPRALQAVGK